MLTRSILLAGFALGLVYTAIPKQEPVILSPIVPRTEAQEQVEVVEPWCEGEINSLFCNPEYEWDAKKMIAICMIENGYHLRDAWKADMVFDGNPDGSIDRGICSINSIHGYDEQMLFIPEFNVAKAYEIWLSQGYEAWVVYVQGRHSLAFRYLD